MSLYTLIQYLAGRYTANMDEVGIIPHYSPHNVWLLRFYINTHIRVQAYDLIIFLTERSITYIFYVLGPLF